MKVVVVASHVDDAEFAMAMHIIKLVSSGDRVHVHVFSGGAEGDARAQEGLKAAGMLGVERYVVHNFPDGQFASVRQQIQRTLFGVLGGQGFGALYSHWTQDQHSDHVVLGVEAMHAAYRYCPNILQFESPYSLMFDPTVFSLCDAELLERKVSILRCFRSQRQFPLEQLARYRADIAGAGLHHGLMSKLPEQYAERFHVVREVRPRCAHGDA